MPTRKDEPDVSRALARLRELGLLLESDAELESLAALVVGRPVRGSWWSHPAGRRIFAAASGLEDHPDVVVLALVNGKRTYVHRRLWPALLAVARSRGEWKARGLSAAARELLAEVERLGEVRLEDLAPAAPPRGRSARAAARELEARLLVHAGSEHSESGAHEKRLMSWRRWREVREVKGRLPSAGSARAQLELAAAGLARQPGKALLPWQAGCVPVTARGRRSGAASSRRGRADSRLAGSP